MTLPLNKKQKQLVEKSMDLVPIMIRSMTRTATYVTEEEQQELCQIGYLALCRSAVGFEEGRSFQPYAKTIIRHAILICFPTRIHKQLTRKRTQTRPCFLSI